MAKYTEMDAEISECERYRYTLYRAWKELPESTLMFIGLNPSTADATQDDPTLRRCVGFAKFHGFDRLVMCNLFAYRATDPKKLYELGHEAVGPTNDDALLAEAFSAKKIVCGWGNHGQFNERGRDVIRLLRKSGYPLGCLGVTRVGQPKHPLYLKSETTFSALPRRLPC